MINGSVPWAAQLSRSVPAWLAPLGAEPHRTPAIEQLVDGEPLRNDRCIISGSGALLVLTPCMGKV